MSPWRGRRILRSRGTTADGLAVQMVSSFGCDFNHDFNVSSRQTDRRRPGDVYYQEGATPMEEMWGARFYKDEAVRSSTLTRPSPRGEVMLSTYALLRHERRAEREIQSDRLGAAHDRYETLSETDLAS